MPQSVATSDNSHNSFGSSLSLVAKLHKYELKRKFYEKLEDFTHRVLLHRESGLLVYRARCAYSGGIVVLKGYSRDALTPQTRQRVYNEVNILQAAQCPFILKCFDSFEDQGWWWLVLENCACGDLASVLVAHGEQPSEGWVVSQVTLPLLQTLAYLHNEGIIHRDVQPQHVLFNSEKVAKLSSFFLAHDVTKHGYPKDLVGSLEYAAPEVLRLTTPEHIAQARAGLASPSYDDKVDIWQLGILVYDVLVGEPPFTSNDDEELTHRISHQQPQFPDGLSDTAVDFILACLTKEPRERPTARQLLSHPWIKEGLEWVAGPEFRDPVPNPDMRYYRHDFKAGEPWGEEEADGNFAAKRFVWYNPSTWFSSWRQGQTSDQDLDNMEAYDDGNARATRQKRYQAKDAAVEEQGSDDKQIQQGGLIRTAPDLATQQDARSSLEMSSQQNAPGTAFSTSGVWFSRSNRNRVQPTQTAAGQGYEQEETVNQPPFQPEADTQGGTVIIHGVDAVISCNCDDMQLTTTTNPPNPKQPPTVVPPLSLPVRPPVAALTESARDSSRHSTPRSGRLAPLPAPHGPAVNTNSNTDSQSQPPAPAVPALGLAGLTITQNTPSTSGINFKGPGL